MQWLSNAADTVVPIHWSAHDSEIEQLLSITEIRKITLSKSQNRLFELFGNELALIGAVQGSLSIQTTQLNATLNSGGVIALTTFDGICELTAAKDCVITIIVLTGKLWNDVLHQCLEKQQLLFPQGMHIMQLFLSILPDSEVDVSDVSAACYQLLLSLRKQAQTIHLHQQYPFIVEAALNIITEEYAFLEGVPDLAERVEVSVGYLTRLFQKFVGVSPGRYLTQFRIAHAKQFLLENEMPISMVADLCGFSSANYFSKVFRQEVGISPSEYLRFIHLQANNSNLPDDIFVL